MARHCANHVSNAYTPTPEDGTKALDVKAAIFQDLGVAVHLCGATDAA
jgi:hypothetical protein